MVQRSLECRGQIGARAPHLSLFLVLGMVGGCTAKQTNSGNNSQSSDAGDESTHSSQASDTPSDSTAADSSATDSVIDSDASVSTTVVPSESSESSESAEDSTSPGSDATTPSGSEDDSQSTSDSTGTSADEGFPAWSTRPPGGLDPKDVPQFVSITFDDNFGLENARGVGGVDWIVEMAKDRKNPAGSGNKATFDGEAVRFAFYHTSSYIDPQNDEGGNLKAWRSAFAAGHEVGDHTVNHHNGGALPAGGESAGNYTVDKWVAEMEQCRSALVDPSKGLGAKESEVAGFRTPFLSYNDHTFSALTQLGFVYDTTLLGCFAAGDDGTNCSWPYELSAGSPDAQVLAQRFKTPTVSEHADLLEFPPVTLVVPPDDVAEKYGFAPGLRSRIPTLDTYPDVYDAKTGHLAGLDYTVLIPAKMTPAEMAATLKYTLDVHLAGNRSPIVFVAHAHMYAFSDPEDNPDTPSAEVRDARQEALEDFIDYALSKPEVRLRSPLDIKTWLENPVPLK